MAQEGITVPTCAYVANNPLKYADANGLRTWNVSGPGWFSTAVSNYLASPVGASAAATIAASPLDVNISVGSLEQGSGPDFAHTAPNSTASPTTINVTIDAIAMADYKSGACQNFKPTAYHNVSELIAHELGCVFHAISITDFHGKPIGHSTGSRSPVPREVDHLFHGKPEVDHLFHGKPMARSTGSRSPEGASLSG